MELSARVLHRTLLLRQHLLERTSLPVATLVEHLVGLQAQDPLPPYLGLAARVADLDPVAVSAALERAELVRLSTLRGTIHLHTPRDAVAVRRWTQPVHDRANRSIAWARPAAEVPGFAEALRAVLASGALPMAAIQSGLSAYFPDVDGKALAFRARNELPLVQLPPRGLWRRSGGVVYDLLERWAAPALSSCDGPHAEPADLVRRYLRAFGPARPADLATWSGLTRLAPLLDAMPDLVRHRDEQGRVLYDLPNAPLAAGTEHAPVRLLGTYDNLWLSHAARDRVMPTAARAAWAGRNGGVASVVLVDGWVAGLWRPDGGRVRDLRLLRDLTRTERSDLDDEIARTETLLAR